MFLFSQYAELVSSEFGDTDESSGEFLSSLQNMLGLLEGKEKTKNALVSRQMSASQLLSIRQECQTMFMNLSMLEEDLPRNKRIATHLLLFKEVK